MLRRWWSPQVARGLLLTYMILALFAGGFIWLRESDQGQRLTKVEKHVVVLERAKLCSTVPVCRRLLDNLLADATSSQTRLIRGQMGKLEDGVARRLAQAHKRSEKRKSAVKRHPRSPVLKPPGPLTPTVAEPAATPAPTITPGISGKPAPPVIPPAPPLPEVHVGHAGPLGLPCIHVAHIEVACHPAGGATH